MTILIILMIIGAIGFGIYGFNYSDLPFNEPGNTILYTLAGGCCGALLTYVILYICLAIGDVVTVKSTTEQYELVSINKSTYAFQSTDGISFTIKNNDNSMTPMNISVDKCKIATTKDDPYVIITTENLAGMWANLPLYDADVTYTLYLPESEIK